LFRDGSFVLLATALLLSRMLGEKVTSLSIQKSNRRVTHSKDETALSRRSWMNHAGLLVASVATTGVTPSPAFGANDSDSNSYRKQLMNLIQQDKDEETIMAAINDLVPFDPSKRRGAALPEDLDGEWKLLWSAKAEAFSPLLTLPSPLKPDSFQYLGKAASAEVGPDRVAQGLTGGILGKNQLWLSSGVRTSPSDSSILEILPPFRFELGGRFQTNKPKKLIVEGGSDAEFRKQNARTQEAQEAPRNSYQQLYLELEGTGSLRISTITEGDPVIVGAIFVHQKL